jgi:hypothetical protein
MANTTVYVPTGRFPEGIQKKDISFTLNFTRRAVYVDEEFDICVFFKEAETDHDFQVTLTEQEIEMVKIIDNDAGELKTIQEFMDSIVDKEMKDLKNKTQTKKGLHHYNNGDWEQANIDDSEED